MTILANFSSKKQAGKFVPEQGVGPVKDVTYVKLNEICNRYEISQSARAELRELFRGAMSKAKSDEDFLRDFLEDRAEQQRHQDTSYQGSW